LHEYTPYHLSQLKLFQIGNTNKTTVFQIDGDAIGMHAKRTRISDKNPEAGHTCFKNMQKIQASYHGNQPWNLKPPPPRWADDDGGS
jgi:hypothetical protein